MSNPELAKEIVELLKRNNFPRAYSVDEVKQQTHAIVYAVTTQVLGAYGSHLSIAAQGTHGPGVNPHMGQLLSYALSAGPETMRNSEQTYRSVFP
jgi:hypothetical protein